MKQLEAKFKVKVLNYAWDLCGHTGYLFVEADDHFSVHRFLFSLIPQEACSHQFDIKPVVSSGEVFNPKGSEGSTQIMGKEKMDE